MLFTDGIPSRLEDLRVFESGIFEVASVEGIDLEVKLNVAAEEVGDQIMAYLLQPGSGDPQSTQRRQLGLSTLVVSPAMRRWHALHTLALTFRDAYHNQINERYSANWRHYVSAAAEARSVLYRIGLGFVNNPLPRPVTPAVTNVAGLWPANNYSFCVAWVNAAGQLSAPSEQAVLELTDAGAPRVIAISPPAAAIGWHVYATELGGDLRRQNPAMLTLGVPWVPTSAGVLPGDLPGSGQFADVFVTSSQSVPRG